MQTTIPTTTPAPVAPPVATLPPIATVKPVVIPVTKATIKAIAKGAVRAKVKAIANGDKAKPQAPAKQSARAQQAAQVMRVGPKAKSAAPHGAKTWRTAANNVIMQHARKGHAVAKVLGVRVNGDKITQRTVARAARNGLIKLVTK